MNIGLNEMMETIRMVQLENLDFRTVTMGINLLDCADSDFGKNEYYSSLRKNHYFAKNFKELQR